MLRTYSPKKAQVAAVQWEGSEYDLAVLKKALPDHLVLTINEEHRSLVYKDKTVVGSVKLNQWLVINSNREYTVMSDEDFKKTYERSI